jgi:hypothetical protein
MTKSWIDHRSDAIVGFMTMAKSVKSAKEVITYDTSSCPKDAPCFGEEKSRVIG